MNDFSGPERMNAVSFVVNNKAYLGTGYSLDSNDHYYRDFWEYNATTDSWTQKADYPGGTIYEGVAFAVGNYGYVGTGIDSAFTRHNQFYKYDPASNTWSAVASLPTTGRYEAFATATATKGYVGLGHSLYDNFYPKDLWEYDPMSGNWTQLSDLDTTKVFPTACAIQNKLYIIGGRVFPYVGDSSGSADMIIYNLDSNTWHKVNAPNIKRIGGGATTIGNKGYFGLGWSGAFALLYDLWEFSPSGVNGIESISSTASCKIYPNPTSSTVHLCYTPECEQASFSLYSALGQEVSTFILPASNETSFHVNQLPAGYYFYQIKKNQNIILNGHLLIQK